MFISIDIEKTFDKTQYPFMIKMQQTGNIGELFIYFFNFFNVYF